ncbi:MAG: hypothetical protein ABJ327_27085 [Litoreibacter sp.]
MILAVAAMILAPQAVAIYPMTTYAFPILAVAAILDTLGTAAERHRMPLKLLAWAFLCRSHPHSPDAPQRPVQRRAGDNPSLDRHRLAPPPRHLGRPQGTGPVF